MLIKAKAITVATIAKYYAANPAVYPLTWQPATATAQSFSIITPPISGIIPANDGNICIDNNASCCGICHGMKRDGA